MFGISSGFKRNKPRSFSYKPMYYDAEQEERDERRAKYEEKEYKPGSIVRNMRRERYVDNNVNAKKMAAEARNRIMMRMIILLILLFTAGVIIMNSTMLEEFFSVFINGR